MLLEVRKFLAGDLLVPLRPIPEVRIDLRARREHFLTISGP